MGWGYVVHFPIIAQGRRYRFDLVVLRGQKMRAADDEVNRFVDRGCRRLERVVGPLATTAICALRRTQ